MLVCFVFQWFIQSFKTGVSLQLYGLFTSVLISFLTFVVCVCVFQRLKRYACYLITCLYSIV